MTKIRRGPRAVFALLAVLGVSAPLAAQQRTTLKFMNGATDAGPSLHYKQQPASLLENANPPAVNSAVGDYQIGPEDLLKISVLEAPELSRTVRVSDDGAISLPLLGTVEAAGLSTRRLETLLENLLRQTYMKDPQVSVFVKEMRSHTVSVFGAVEKPGVYQIRNAKTLIEVLSMAQGLADDAGDTVIVMRNGADSGDPGRGVLLDSKFTVTNEPSPKTTDSEPSPVTQTTDRISGAESITVNLKDLLDSSSSRSNVLVYPGDAVKVTRAGVVYVVGDVHRPGGFLLKTNENISVLQAIALAEGITSTSNRKKARIILAGGANGLRKEIPINLKKILAGKAPDPLLKPNDILFVPTSSGKAALHGLAQTTSLIAASVSNAAVYRW